MHIEFLVEEPSVEAALNNLAPAILGPDIIFQVFRQGLLELIR